MLTTSLGVVRRELTSKPRDNLQFSFLALILNVQAHFLRYDIYVLTKFHHHHTILTAFTR